ncbi:MAG: hypothetical protein EZS28_053328 [Streblomastix strix]|uniref:Uncharacterized protein n=1 Tax=Streblomastix strix TaxID=222440 RepID=A0A5J4RE19_9EUKA|nr:MAG: hypothetical protein EZS28_053328 [Streblomastix strix]
MWRNKWSQKRLEKLCVVTREENGVEEKIRLWKELDQELISGVVNVVEVKEIRHSNPSHMVPNKGGKWRKVLDCRWLNKETTKVHFKIESVKQVMESIQMAEFGKIL